MPLRGLAVCALLLVACDGDRQGPPLPTQEVVETGLAFHDNLAVSPDGRHIAFTSRIGEEDWVYIADIDGGNARRVSLPARQVFSPVFSPDGSTLAWRSANSREIWSVPVSGGDPALLVGADSSVLVRYINLAFSRDGSRIFFDRDGPGPPSVWSVPSSGGDVTRLLPEPGTSSCCARPSPDGAKIAISFAEGASGPWVGVVDAATGAVDRITTEGYEVFRGWSPDGSELVYVSRRSGQADIWTVPATGGEGKQLTRDIRADGNPEYSPDGRWIAYESERGGQDDIWIVPAAGGEAIRVTNDRASNGPPHWMADGSALLYTSYADLPGLYAVPAAGGTPRRLSPADRAEWGQDISPDGRTVVHNRRQAGLSEIWLTPIRGGDSRPLVTGSHNGSPFWSPDGSMIAYWSRRGPLGSVWIMDVATGEERQVSPSGIDTGVAGWLPDGSRFVLWTSQEPGPGARFLAVPPTGGEATPILETSVEPEDLTWSPDGSMVAVTQVVDGDPGLYLFPSGGGPATLLTSGQQVYRGGRVAAWSSDGRRIAYAVTSTDGGREDIYVVNVDGSERRRLTRSPVEERHPRWSPDDSEIYFMSGRFGLSAVDVATGEVRTIYEGGVRSAEGFTWQGFDLTPDGGTILFGGRIDDIPLMRVDVSELLSARR